MAISRYSLRQKIRQREAHALNCQLYPIAFPIAAHGLLFREIPTSLVLLGMTERGTYQKGRTQNRPLSYQKPIQISSIHTWDTAPLSIRARKVSGVPET